MSLENQYFDKFLYSKDKAEASYRLLLAIAKVVVNRPYVSHDDARLLNAAIYDLERFYS